MSENNVRERTNRILPSSQYIDLRLPGGRLAGRFDPARFVLEVKERGVIHYFDLTQVVEMTGQNDAQK